MHSTIEDRDIFFIKVCLNTLLSFPGDMDIRIANKYRLGRKIGGGSFGDIYLGKQHLVMDCVSFKKLDLYVCCFS